MADIIFPDGTILANLIANINNFSSNPATSQGEGELIYNTTDNNVYKNTGTAGTPVWVSIGGVSDHTLLTNLNSTSYYHLTSTNHTDLTNGGNSSLHYHQADRDATDGADGDASTATEGTYTTILSYFTSLYGHTHPIGDITGHNTSIHDALNIDADTVDGAHLSTLCRIGSTDNNAYVEFGSGYGMNWNSNSSHGIRGFSSGNLEIHAEIGAGDDINMYPDDRVYVSGDFYATGDVSALTFTDRTPFYEGDALTEIKRIKGTQKNGIDHLTLPDFVKAKVIKKIHEKDSKTGERKLIEIIETDERNLGNMISVLTVAVQQLTKKVEDLEAKNDIS